MKFQQAFEKALKEHIFIRIYTEEPDNECYDGIIVALTDDYLIMLQELDYEFDGYQLIPRNQVSGHRQSDVESFSQRLMTANGDFLTSNVPDWITYSENYKDIFNQILAKCPWVRVGWVCPNCDNIHYDVGNIKSTDDDTISVVLYDRDGQSSGEMGWSMSKVYSLEFNTKFLKRLSQFIEMELATIQ